MNSVYVHIPFCIAKCHYCGFNSQPLEQPAELKKYFQALSREIGDHRTGIDILRTIYFGGGTPTIAPVKLIEMIVSRMQPWAPNAELTIEANPGTVTLERLRSLKGMGFNRLSLGVQSFNDARLKQIGRVHTGRQAAKAFELGSQAGFANISLDLIYALPGQSLNDWKEDLAKALSLGPQHLSLYSLTYEPETEFTKKKAEGLIHPVSEELEEEMYLTAIETLGSAGYLHYEVSNFAQKNFRSRHNINYWQAGDYLGFGAGAHSHLDGKRWSNYKNPDQYIAALTKGESPVEMEEKLTRDQQIFEAIFLGLRMTEGIDIEEFRTKWGIKPGEYLPQVWRKLEKNGCLETKGDNLRLNIEGILLSDTILSDFAP